MPRANAPTYQEVILRLSTFWAEQGCVLQQPYDIEVGAGTMSPETFLRALGPRPYRVAYIQPSRRPADGRYGDNPNRLYKHMQMQVILKPPPEDVQELYLQSLVALGVDLRKHDIKFEEDNWESPTLGAWGVGWQVMLDGLEITQFTYFQQCGGIDLDPICAELTYGMERITAFLQDVDSIYDIVWARDPKTGTAITYRDVRHQDELQLSVYNFEAADVSKAWKHLEMYEAECQILLDEFWKLTKPKDTLNREAREHEEHQVGLSVRAGDPDPYRYITPCSAPSPAEIERFPLLAGYELCLKCSHLFNILDARGAISVTERVGVIARVRQLAVGLAKAYLAQQNAALEAGKAQKGAAH
jgi:glycyl-tRNA synthetase alpha chain